MVPLHHGHIENGKLILSNPDRYYEWIKTLSGPVELVVFKKQIKRTPKSNRYYWAYLDLISKETGDDPDDLHDYLKNKLLKPREKIVMGNEVVLPASTKVLNTIEFGEYISQIELLTGIPAPNPNDVYVA